MNTATIKQLNSLNQILREKGCQVDSRTYFLSYLFYCLENDRDLFLKTAISSSETGKDLWQKLSELFLYIGIPKNARMEGSPDVTYSKEMSNVKIMPIVFNPEMRSILITLAQKRYSFTNRYNLDNAYLEMAKQITIGGMCYE